MAAKKAKKSGVTEWWTLVGKSEGAQIYSDFEDPAGRKFSFLYTKGEVYLYPGEEGQFYSMPLEQIGKGPGMGGFDLIRQQAGMSHESIAFRWLQGCLDGARGFGK